MLVKEQIAVMMGYYPALIIEMVLISREPIPVGYKFIA